MTPSTMSRLKRPIHPMPDEVRVALQERRLMAAYEARPAYQRNDYLGWITRATKPATQHKRLAQMLDELAAGDKYMNMMYRPKKRPVVAEPEPESAIDGTEGTADQG